MQIEMTDPGGSSTGGTVMRDYRKGNWTVSETMILIEAKKMDDERRMKRSGDTEARSKPAELRWKWVEDYCWRKGCHRSQNQCNDKWDNLMRDYKKVREYERRVAERGATDASQQPQQSYWKLEKNERKEKNLPTNMLPQIYDALVDVVERKGTLRIAGGPSSGSSSVPPTVGYVMDRPIISSSVQQQPCPSLPTLLPHHISTPVQPLLPLPPPTGFTTPPPPPSPPPPTTQQEAGPPPHSEPLTTVGSDTSEYSDSPAKRRRRKRGGEGTSAGTSSDVGAAISRSATIIAEALQACEEREERRHREMLRLHERRLQIEESKTEVNRQGINGLVDAINKLANSILALASHKSQSTSK